MGTQPAVRPSGDTITDGSDYAVKVLVIDDEPLLRDVLAEFLELLGHEADLAADARDGLARSTRRSIRSCSRTFSCRD